MRNFIIIILALFVIGVAIFLYNKQNNVLVQPVAVEEESIVGCYVSLLAKDVYALKIESQTGENFTGRLSFKNFEKDSSSGTYAGTFKDDILLGDYDFLSEGTNSLMQVIFKKSGDTFVRGYADLSATGDRFADISKVTFDPKQTFILSANCPI